jgi:hypothetical protein
MAESALAVERRDHDRTRRSMAYIREKGARFARASILSGEVMLGAALAGMIQGLHERKEGETGGAKIAGIPTDLLIGSALAVGSMFEIAGEEWSPHIGHLGLGFLAGFANDFGFHMGENKRTKGHYFAHAEPAKRQIAAPAPTKTSGAFDPQQMAESLLRARQQHAPG